MVHKDPPLCATRVLCRVGGWDAIGPVGARLQELIGGWWSELDTPFGMEF